MPKRTLNSLAALCVVVAVAILLLGEAEALRLRTIRTKVADVKGAGMDGGTFGVLGLGGGRFQMTICAAGQSCCSTGRLNTKDNNWERGEINLFVGRQLGECENLDIGAKNVTVTLHHEGSDGGQLEHVQLLDTYASSEMLECPIGVKLRESASFTSTCVKRNSGKCDAAGCCNGHASFCTLDFDRFTFAGTHNSGTGQGEGNLECASKNQDLNVTEQLDIGIRFFDFDAIYSTGLPGCDGLETGHGKVPSLGIYQCYGGLSALFSRVRDWMNANPTQVIVLYFGELQYADDTYPKMVESLRAHFPTGANASSVGMNTLYKTTGMWPTLGQAVNANARIFVFIRSDKVSAVGDSDLVREVQVSVKTPNPKAEPNAVTILSTYTSRSVNSNCDAISENALEACPLKASLTKVALMGPFSLSSGLKCLWTLARRCNRVFENALTTCLESKSVINFVQADYPNYPAQKHFTIMDYCFDSNLQRARKSLS